MSKLWAEGDRASSRVHCLLRSLSAGLKFPAPEEYEAANQQRQKAGSSQTHRAQYGGRIFTIGGVVVRTEKQNPIHRRPDAVVGGLYQAELEIFGREVNAIKIPGRPSFGSERHNSGGMEKHLGLRVPAIMKADGVSHRANVRFRAGQKMPALRRCTLRVQLHNLIPFRRSV